MICAHEPCAKEFTPNRKDHRFCSGTCRSASHKQHGSAVTIKSIRALARGGYSIILHSHTAPTLQAGSRCRLETE